MFCKRCKNYACYAEKDSPSDCPYCGTAYLDMAVEIDLLSGQILFNQKIYWRVSLEYIEALEDYIKELENSIKEKEDHIEMCERAGRV
jgi:hypothetical protein